MPRKALVAVAAAREETMALARTVLAETHGEQSNHCSHCTVVRPCLRVDQRADTMLALQRGQYRRSIFVAFVPKHQLYPLVREAHGDHVSIKVALPLLAAMAAAARWQAPHAGSAPPTLVRDG